DRADPGGLLTGRVDLARVGALGHSFGGAVAAHVCAVDPRFKAGVDLDGLFFGAPLTRGIGKPFLFFCDDTSVPAPAEMQALSADARRYWTFVARNAQCIRQSLAGEGGYWLTLRGARHMNFHDGVLYSPLRRWTDAGPI